MLSVPVSIEAKGRANFNPLKWVKEARSRRLPEDEFPPWAVMRCNGQGEASLPEWIVLMALEDHTAMVEELLKLRAGFCGEGCTGWDCTFCQRNMTYSTTEGWHYAPQEGS